MKPTNPTLTKMMTPVAATVRDMINYDNFTYRAEVDWVELHLRTREATNHWTVTELMGVPYAKSLNEGPGGAATWFSVKIHNPKNWQAVQDMVDRFTDKHPLAETPVVTAIEIAFDAYSKFEDYDDLTSMAARFVKYSSYIDHENRRYVTSGKHNVDLDVVHHHVTLERLRGDYSFCAGDHKPTKGRPASAQAMRVYVKKTDAGAKLPLAKQHRARTERTLTLVGFNQRSLSWWKRYDFTELALYFKFRKLKPLLPACVRFALEALPFVVDSCNPKRRTGGGVRKHMKSTVADIKLNRLAYEALRGLTDRMKYESRIAKARKVARIAGLRVS